MFTTRAPCRTLALSRATSFPPVRINSSQFNNLAFAPLPSQDWDAYKQHEFLTLEEAPQIHVMRGFSPHKPIPQVIDAARAKANQFSVVAFPQLAEAPTIIQENSRSARLYPQSPLKAVLPKPQKIPQAQEAFFVLDLDRVRAKARSWNDNFPTVKPHYAVKANPNPAILRLMANELNLNFDCASLNEIEAVLKEGVNPSRIVFANPCKALSHIEYARRVGVLRTTFDSESELYKIKAVHPTAQVILRIWVDDKDSQCPLSNKYGAHIAEVPKLLNLTNQLGLQCIGVSFHVGSGASPITFKNALVDAKKAFDVAADKGIQMRMLDIGGGFPGTDQEDVSLSQISQIVRPILERDFKHIQHISEPGRLFCSEAQTLATQIIGKRVRGEHDHDRRREYYVNDGLYQSFNCILYDHSILLQESAESAESSGSQQGVQKHPSLIFGQTCDGLDTICKDILLPDLRVGDWLVLPNMGAYTNGASSSFNGFPLNETVVLNSQAHN